MKYLFTFFLFLNFSCFSQSVHIGSNFNNVEHSISMFIQNKYEMVETANSMHDGVLTITYKQRVYTGEKRFIKLIYTLDKNNEISAVKAEGTFKDIVNLFCDYWNTRINVSGKNELVAVKHFVSDVIRVKRSSAGVALLTIDKS